MCPRDFHNWVTFITGFSRLQKFRLEIVYQVSISEWMSRRLKYLSPIKGYVYVPTVLGPYCRPIFWYRSDIRPVDTLFIFICVPSIFLFSHSSTVKKFFIVCTRVVLRSTPTIYKFIPSGLPVHVVGETFIPKVSTFFCVIYWDNKKVIFSTLTLMW